MRVYIKRQEDYGPIRAACEQRLGELPTIYAVADVCRPELLVEIEGISFAHKAAIPRTQVASADSSLLLPNAVWQGGRSGRQGEAPAEPRLAGSSS